LVIGGGGVGVLFCLGRPQDKDLPADLRENPDCVFGTRGAGISFKGLSCGLFHSSFREAVEDGAVEAALRRDELSVVDAVLLFDAPLPLRTVSSLLPDLTMWVPDRFPFTMPSNMFPSLCDVLGLAADGGGRWVLAAFDNFTPPSNDLLLPSGLSNTLNVDSDTGRA